MTGSTGLVCIVIIEWWWVLYPRTDIRWLFFHIYLLENYIDVWKETGVGAIYRKAWKVLSFKPWLKISFISCHTQRYMHLQQSTKISFQVVFSVRKCYLFTPRSQNSKRQLLVAVAVGSSFRSEQSFDSILTSWGQFHETFFLIILCPIAAPK